MNYVLMISASFFAGIFVCIILAFGLMPLIPEDQIAQIPPFAIVFSATVALTSALFTISNNNKRVREKNTLDVIAKDKGNIGPEYLFIKKYLADNEDQQEEALKYLARHNIEFEEMRPILEKLNELEHLCEGVIKGFYDIDILRNNRGVSIVRIWERLLPYIQERRLILRETLGKDHIFIGAKESNIPFYWIEKCYYIFTQKGKSKRTEKKYLFVAALLLFLPCLPAILAVAMIY